MGRDSRKRARAAGRKLMFFVNGSRGDVQPFIALGLALKQAGFVVRIAAPCNHVAFVQEYGLDVVAVGADVEEVMNRPDMREAMGKGSMIKIASVVKDWNSCHFPGTMSQLIAVVRSFQPDVMFSSP